MMVFETTGIECLGFRETPLTSVQCSLLNYFVPRKHPRRANSYMRGWPDHLGYYRERLGKVGVYLHQLARQLDVDHPDILHVCDGVFSLSSRFSQIVLNHTLHSYGREANSIPIVKRAMNRLKPEKLVHLMKSPAERSAVQSLRYRELGCVKSQHENYFLRRKDVWDKLPASFLNYVWDSHGGEYLGFRQLTMTDATGILLKATKSHKTSKVVVFPIGHDVSSVAVVQHFEQLQRPIFDYYWKLVTNKGYVTLGERDSKCYFLIASIRK